MTADWLPLIAVGVLLLGVICRFVASEIARHDR